MNVRIHLPGLTDLVTPSGTIMKVVSSIEVTFDSPIDHASVTTGNVSLSGPQGSVPISGFFPTAPHRFVLQFSPLRAVGTYT